MLQLLQKPPECGFAAKALFYAQHQIGTVPFTKFTTVCLSHQLFPNYVWLIDKLPSWHGKMPGTMQGRVTHRFNQAQAYQPFAAAHYSHSCTLQLLLGIQVYDDLKQDLQSLSDKHTALLAQQHACGTQDLLTYDSDLARLRSELAEAKADACMNADKLAAAQETCRYHLSPWFMHLLYILCLHLLNR